MSYEHEKTTPPHDGYYAEEKEANHGVVTVTEPLEDDLATTHLGDHGIKRDLPPRVLSMIAIAGTIGTGLFVGSGNSLVRGGPVGLWLGYSIMGMAVGMMMTTLGEMSCYAPNVGGFTEMATKYADPALGFMSGINYTLSTGFGIPSEISAIAVLFTYWDHNTAHAPAYIALFIVLTVAINICGVKWFGEMEFAFAILKVVTLVGLMIFALVANLGGIPPKHEYIGGKYWRTEPFNDTYLNIQPVALARFCGFWSVFTQAAFSYSAIEGIGLMAGEAHNPRKSLRTAIRTVFYRIVGIYVLATLLIGLTVSQYSPDLLRAVAEDAGTAGASPFVVLCSQMGVKVLPHIVNAVVITSALSSGNEQTYANSRNLMAMARANQLPKAFLKTTKHGVPWVGVCVSAAFSLLAFLSVSNGSNQAFIWLSNLSALAGLVTWTLICFSYTRFRRACVVQGVDRNKFTFKGYFQPYMAWFCVIFFTIILIFNGYTCFIPTFSVSDFFASYVTLLVIFVAWAAWKVIKRTKMVPLDEMDLSGGPPEAMRGTRYDPTFNQQSYQSYQHA